MDFSPFLWTLIWNIVIAIWIIFVIFITKIIKNKLVSYIEYITALTVWLLLWIIFLGFIPEIINEWNLEWKEFWIYILIWIFLFYLLELFLHWHHCKDLWHGDLCHSHHTHEHKNWLLMFWWTLLHNAFHWIVLFSAYSIDPWFWIVTTIAILFHSIPQNIVNYIMNHDNIKYAYFAAFWWIFWALLTYPFSDFLIENKFYILAIIVWWLLYTSLADIFPEFKWKWSTRKKISYFVFILIWIISFLFFEESAHILEPENNHWKYEKIENEEYMISCIGTNWNWTWFDCEWISKESCEKIWWIFNECASSCRNDKESQECIMMCVPVCEFN